MAFLGPAVERIKISHLRQTFKLKYFKRLAVLRYRRVELRTQVDLGLSEPADDGQQRHRYKDA